jgi:hypothetical protein
MSFGSCGANDVFSRKDIAAQVWMEFDATVDHGDSNARSFADLVGCGDG